MKTQLAKGTPRGEGEALLVCCTAGWFAPDACSQCSDDNSPSTLPDALDSSARYAGAKVVARLAFKKIQAMQASLAEQRQALADKEAAVALLQQTISSLQEAASQKDAAVQAAEARVAEVHSGMCRAAWKSARMVWWAGGQRQALASGVCTSFNSHLLEPCPLQAEATAAQAQASKEEAEGRAVQLASDIASLEGQRSQLEQQLAAAGQEAAQLSSDAAAQAAVLTALREEMAAAQAELAAKVRHSMAVCSGRLVLTDPLCLHSLHLCRVPDCCLAIPLSNLLLRPRRPTRRWCGWPRSATPLWARRMRRCARWWSCRTR